MVSATPSEPAPDGRGAKIDATVDDLLAWAEEAVGSAVTAADRSGPVNTSLVLELVDAKGDHWFLKHPRDAERFRRELHAYEKTLASFGDRVPRLVGSNDSYRCLLLAAVPGQIVRGTDAASEPDVHRQAGTLLAKLHRSEWPTPSPEMGAKLAKQRAHVLERAKPVLDQAEYRYLRHATNALTRDPAPKIVPCHRDFYPNNWLIDQDGTVRLIDFGRAAPDLVARDLVLLVAGRDWGKQFELREAFFEGYGRRLDDDEQAQLHGFVTIGAVTKVLRAANRGNQPAMLRAKKALERLKGLQP